MHALARGRRPVEARALSCVSHLACCMLRVPIVSIMKPIVALDHEKAWLALRAVLNTDLDSER